MCLFSSPGIFRCFLLAEKKKVLTWSVDLRGRGHIYVVGLFTRDVQSSFFSFRKECVDHEGLFLRERKFDWRKSLDERLACLGRRVDM